MSHQDHLGTGAGGEDTGDAVEVAGGKDGAVATPDTGGERGEQDDVQSGRPPAGRPL